MHLIPVLMNMSFSFLIGIACVFTCFHIISFLKSTEYVDFVNSFHVLKYKFHFHYREDLSVKM